MANDNKTSTRQVIIKVQSQDNGSLRKMAAEMGLLNKSVKGVGATFNSLRNAMGVIFGGQILGVGISEIAQLSDSIQGITNRLAAFTGSTETAASRLRDIVDISKQTKTSIDGVGQVYFRLSAATKDTGISSEGLKTATSALANSFRLSGSTAGEATSASIQLAQGLASGQLRGQELRSVLEANVIVGGLLAKQFNTTRGGLYKLAEQGKITSAEVLLALINNSKDLTEQAGKMNTTFEQTVDLFKGDLAITFNKLNEATGASSAFSKFMRFVADNLGPITVGVLGLAASFVAAGKGLAIFASAGSVIAAVFAVLLSKAFLIGAAITAVSVVLLKLFDMDSIEAWTSAWETTKDVLSSILLIFVKISGEALKVFNLDVFDWASWADEGIAAINKVKTETQSKAANTSYGAARLMSDSGYVPDDKKVLERLAKEQAKIEADKKRKDYLDKIGPLGRYNQKFNLGSDLKEYMKGFDAPTLENLNKKFKEGKLNLAQYRDEARKLQEIKLNEKLKEGTISFNAFNQSVDALKMEELNDKFTMGTVSLKDYNKELIAIDKTINSKAFSVGITDFLESIGTVSQGIAGIVTKTFDDFSERIFQSTKGVAIDFKAMTQSILDDLTRLAIKQYIVGGIAKGLGGIFDTSGTSSSMSATNSSSGTGYLGVNTDFNSSSVQSYGVSSKALPIAPSSQGSMVVNITNTSGAEITQTESKGPNGEKILDVLIASKVKEGIANGSFDKQFSSAYGMRRQGV